jgi:hypothetical protein
MASERRCGLPKSPHLLRVCRQSCTAAPNVSCTGSRRNWSRRVTRSLCLPPAIRAQARPWCLPSHVRCGLGGRARTRPPPTQRCLPTWANGRVNSRAEVRQRAVRDDTARPHRPARAGEGAHALSRRPFISISDNQRLPLPGASLARHRVPQDAQGDLQPRFEAGDYLAFLGRLAPEKGAHVAIELAQRAGVPCASPPRCRERIPATSETRCYRTLNNEVCEVNLLIAALFLLRSAAGSQVHAEQS